MGSVLLMMMMINVLKILFIHLMLCMKLCFHNCEVEVRLMTIPLFLVLLIGYALQIASVEVIIYS